MNEIQLKRKLKYITILFSIISICILLFGVFASSALDKLFEETMSGQIDTQITEYKSNFKRQSDFEFQKLSTISSLVEYIGDDSLETLKQTLEEQNLQNSFLRLAYFSKDGNGVAIGSEDSDTFITASEMPKPLQDVIGSALTGQKTISQPYLDKEKNESVINLAVPVKKEDQVIGVLVASKLSTVLNEILDGGTILSDDGVAAVLDSQGNILAGSQRVASSGLKVISGWEAISSADKQEILRCLENQESETLYFEIYGYPCYARIEPADILDWSIIVLDAQKGANQALYNNISVTRITTIIPLVLAVVCIFFSYRQMSKTAKDLLRLAFYDSLTGSYNMERFNQLLSDQLKEDKSGCVVSLNVRQFKFINELFGVEQGNQLLHHIASVLNEHIKDGEFFCRESADNFFIFLHETDKKMVEERMHTVLQQISRLPLNRHQTYPILLYCGVAFTVDFEGKEYHADELMTRVMFAIKRAKQGTSNNVCFYDIELHKTEQLQNYIESHMKQALQDEEFKIYLQPKIDLQKNKLGGAEALVRWQTSEGKMLFPDTFIPLFEENGFCVNLDLYMVEQTCRVLRGWMDKGYEIIPISVNQSKLLFYEEDYADRLFEIVNQYGISPRYIILEILEGLTFNNLEALNARIRSLQEKGFRISMDDFGSGYSSLNTLGNLHIDELKIDRAFLMTASKKGGERQRMIIEQIIILAQKMNIDTVVEGIETEENAQTMKKCGCHFGQGYYYSRPIPTSEFEKNYFHSEADGHTGCDRD